VGSDTNLRALPSQRKGRGRPARLKSVVVTPDILRGTSSKKRNISQIQNSPGRSRISPARKKIQKRSTEGGAQSKTGASTSGAVNLNSAANPPIQLIPAVAKKKPDFQFPPPQGP